MKKTLLVLIAIALSAVWYFDLTSYLSFEALRASLTELQSFRDGAPFKTAIVLFAVYVLVTALSIPGAVPLTLLSGAIFGLGWGTLIVSFASTFGASCAFLAARYLFRDWTENRFKRQYKKIDEAVEREGALYLFSLRLVPVFPFFLINLLMGLTKLPLLRYYWVSQIGMLPGTLVYVNAGRSLAELESPAGILSAELLIAFLLIAILPWISKGIINYVKAKKVYSGYTRPTEFDTNLLVIGAGAGGLVSSYIGSAVKAKVTLVEAGKMGGDCLNHGCVPSKALIRCARAAHEARTSQRFGVYAEPRINFSDVMSRVNGVVTDVAPHDSVERYTDLGVDVQLGWAKFIDPWRVEISQGESSHIVSAENIILATGAKPRSFQIEGLDPELTLTTDTLWGYLSRCERPPERLVILGAGPIGAELSQALNRLGISVTLVAKDSRILRRETSEAAETVQKALISEGVDLRLNSTIQCCLTGEDGTTALQIVSDDQVKTLRFTRLLFAIGREPDLSGTGLDALGFGKGTPELNSRLQTRFPHIFAVGDLAGPYQFTHAAAHQAWYASVNALFGRFKSFSVDYSLIPRVTFTDPEIAAVGLSSVDAAIQHIEVEVTRFDLEELDRAIAEGIDEGYIEVITAVGSDRILGVTIVAEHASEMLAPFLVAMRHKLGMNKLLAVLHAYPTLGESSKYVAGNWKRAHAPVRVMRMLEWWFSRRLKSVKGDSEKVV